jgi:hypothetical protein
MKKTLLFLLTIASSSASAQKAPVTFTSEQDHQNMMDQLGIKAVRPGPSGNDSAPNHANYNEALANPYPDLPDVLTMKNGTKVTTAAMWPARRAEIKEDMEREIYGRLPHEIPKVQWNVVATEHAIVGQTAVVAKQMVGHVDNSAYPAINVDIAMTVVVPTNATGPVPVLMMFGRAVLPAAGTPAGNPATTQQLLADGWGYVMIDPSSIQADNGAGITRGIIGLVNEGQPRKPDDWGALRAWAWGAARGLDYLETDPAIDAKHVGIEGVSRYGKAALVTLAFEPRFAMGLIGSSGKGGATLHRRVWGEAVESLTGGEYYWMAGNYMKYGASESAFGSRNAGDMPVDSHELIAMCAPRLTFISYGIPEKGDAKWLDHQGSYMATIAAGPVFKLLGAKDLGVSNDYHIEKMPAVNVGLLDGQLAWRQHDGGHTDAPNVKYFISWADKFMRAPVVSATTGWQETWPADKPTPRTDANSMLAHQQLLAKRTQGKIDVYFEGNSIVRRWGATDYPQNLANWNANFHGWNAADFGWGADKIEHMLWRIENGELDGVNPKVIVLAAGTNNVGARAGGDAKVADITRGIKALVDLCRAKAPNATIILNGIFPRGDDMAVVAEINRINANVAKMADGRKIRYINVNDKLADANGKLYDGMTVDKLHPTVKGYQIWADALKPVLRELLGPPAATDLAPPPTGDPSAKKPAQ